MLSSAAAEFSQLPENYSISGLTPQPYPILKLIFAVITVSEKRVCLSFTCFLWGIKAGDRFVRGGVM